LRYVLIARFRWRGGYACATFSLWTIDDELMTIERSCELKKPHSD